MIKKVSIGLCIVLVGGVIGGWLFLRAGVKAEPSYRMGAVVRDTIVVSVSGSGQISAENTIEIKPEASGKIVSILARQGDAVKKGQVIARIDSRNAQLALNTARASLANAQANYRKLVAGLTAPELEVAKTALKSAELSLANSRASRDTTIENADITLETAKRAFSDTKEQQTLLVKNSLSTFLNASLEATPATTDTTVTASLSGAYTGSEQGSYAIAIKSSTTGFNYEVSGLETYSEEVKRGFGQPLGSRGLFITISSIGTLKEGMQWIVYVPNIRAAGYLSSSNSYQTALQNQSHALINGRSTLDAAQIAHNRTVADASASVANSENALTSARAAYDLKIAAANPEDTASARASIASAQAQVDTARNNLLNTNIAAPLDGTLAVFSLNPSDQASPSASIGTLITSQQTAKITLNEVDAARIHLGDRATLTFDALPNFSLAGRVAAIDALGTVSQGVVNYTVKIALDSQDQRIKPGMSVAAAIIIATKPDVLTLPAAAVKIRGGASTVDVFDPPVASNTDRVVKTSAKPVSRQIETGISNDTLTEIVSGISEGDAVVTQTILPNARPTTAGNSAFGIPPMRVGGSGQGGGGFRQGGGGAR